MSAVPQISFTANGLVVPTQAAILAGVLADMNTAFGGNLNLGLSTPQGQLASSQAAMIATAYAAITQIVSNTDPAYSTGRYQDAIGRFYNISRNPPISTALQIACSGLTGATIPLTAQVQDTLGNLYTCQQAAVIPVSGTITLPFTNNGTGAVSVPSSVSIYQSVTGWDSATIVSGVIGSNVESALAFEIRRQQALAVNSSNQNSAILGAVLTVPNVLSAYVQDNATNNPVSINPATSVQGSITGTVLTVSSGSGVLVGQAVSGAGVLNGTTISSLGTGTGGVGTYNLNQSMAVASETLYLGGVSINSNSLYVCVSGGISSTVAAAIWTKKNPGCGMTGNTTVTVYDTSPTYGSPGQPYNITYQTAVNVPVYFSVTIKNNSLVPANVSVLIQNAIIAAFSGADGGQPAHIGMTIISSRYNAGILALGSWAQLLSVTFVDVTDTPTSKFTASVAGTTMTVTAVASGSLSVGDGLVGVNVAAGTTIQAQLTGSAGSAGTYQVSISQAATSAAVQGFTPSLFQDVIGINEMPVTSAPYINVNLV